ncbi:MAG: hypothetical protein ACQESA_01640 [Patescibacteria group bacterium]
MIEVLGLFIFMAGFIIGLGAVTVIDLHGFLGRSSPYWTEATIRTHKVTKPLIWVGTLLATVGGIIFYSQNPITWIPTAHLFVLPILILNGVFLSFYVSPYLLKREREGRSKDLLPRKIQAYITISFVISFTAWWGSVFLLVWYLINHV